MFIYTQGMQGARTFSRIIKDIWDMITLHVWAIIPFISLHQTQKSLG